MRPSDEKMISFCWRERLMRSFVRGHLDEDVRGLGESQPEPMANFFSALVMVWRRIFSAFGVRVVAWRSEMP